MTLRAAICGAGYIAAIHARALKHIKDVELTAVVEKFPDKAGAFAADFSIPLQFESIEDLAASGEADAVIIGTPNFLHAPQAITALEAGLHVLVEKPMAMSAAEGQSMIRASRRNGSVLMVAHCWRFDEEVLWLKRNIDEGKLGRVIRTRGYGVHANWGPAGWFTHRELAGGGALADMGIHAIDTARFLLGDPEPASVYARIGTHYGSYDVEDTALLMITWDTGDSPGEGAVSCIESGWWQPHMDAPEASTQVYGTGGFGQVFPTLLEIPDLTAGKVLTEESGFGFPREPHCLQSMYDRQMEAFIHAVQTGENPVPGGHEGLVNMKIVEAAFESARNGQAVFLNPAEDET